MRISRWWSVGLALLVFMKPSQAQEKRPGFADIMPLLDSRSPQARYTAVNMIGELGTAGKLAVVKLGDIARDDFVAEIADKAAVSLAKIGPAAVPELVRNLKDARPEVRLRSLRALVLIGPDGGRAAPALAECLQDREPVVRSLALQALASMGPQASPAVKALCQNLRDPLPAIRQLTCSTLKGLGPDAVPELTKYLDLGDVNERCLVIEALGEIAREFKDAFPPLFQALKDPEPRIRARTAQTLGALQSRAESALEPLMPLILDPNLEVQQHAYAAVLVIGARDKSKLLRALADHQGKGQWAIPFFLAQYGPHARDAVAPLMKIAGNAGDPNRLGAIIALGQIGLDAKESLPVLTQAMNDPSQPIRGAAYMAAVKVSTDPKEEWRKHLVQVAIQGENFRQLQQLRRKAVRADIVANAGAVVWRPINWKAFSDPAVQSEFNKIVDLHVMLSTANIHFDVKKAGRLEEMRMYRQNILDVREAMLEMPPEAIPALIRGINMTVSMNLGFT